MPIVDDIEVVAESLHKAGTFSSEAFRALARHVAGRNISCSAETGSGASTLLFSHSSLRHIVFSLDGGTGSVNNVRFSTLLRSERVQWVLGPSQLTLPGFRFTEPLDAVLIDGPHAYPFPDLEYYYFYQNLSHGALFVLDDIQIRTIHNLFDFLKVDPMFRLDEVVQNTAFFSRTEAPIFCPTGDSWWEQAYNKL